MRCLVGMILFLLVLLHPPSAAAAPPSKWVGAVVPLHPREEGGTALVPLAAPSKEHPLGTVAVFGQNVSDVEGDESGLVLMAYAWDLAEQRVIAAKPIARLSSYRSVVSAVRDGDRILLVAGGHFQDEWNPTNVVLFTIDQALQIVSREDLGVGQTPSLAISDRWIVAGFFERRTTDVVPAGTRSMGMSLALHAVVLDRATHAVVDARVFQGTRLLYPAFDARLSTHAFAIRDEHVYLSLPGEAEATIVQAKLPSLKPLRTRVLDGFQVAVGCSPVYVVGGSVVAVTPLGWRVMTPELELSPRTFPGAGGVMAWNARRAVLFTTSARGKGLPWRTLDSDGDCEQMIWAWDQPVGLCGAHERVREDDDEPATPNRVVRLR